MNWFLRPEQTVHRYGTKWMDKELLKTAREVQHYSTDIAGKCFVLHVKDYVRGNFII